MARKPTKQLTDRELGIMQVVWQAQSATVAEIQQRLHQNGIELAITTVSTQVQILRRKGHLELVNRRRPYRFRPTRSKDEVAHSMTRLLLERLYAGAREEMVLHLFRGAKISAREARLIRAAIRQEKK